MIETISTQINEYWSWLKERTHIRAVEEWVEITTPFLDRHNDCLQIYVKKEGDFYTLTDGGAVIQDLELCGCDLSTERRQAALKTVIQGLGVKIDNDKSLYTEAGPSDFSMRKHRLVQAMLAVDDMFYTASPVVKSFFAEDVGLWLDKNKVRYITDVKLTGKSGYDHAFEFVIPRSSLYPERILQSINSPRKSAVELFIFKWLDTVEARHQESKAYAVLNDVEEVPLGVMDAFRNHNITPVPWSRRREIEEELAA